MKRTLLFLVLLFTCCSPLQLLAAGPKNVITLHFPEAIIANGLKKVMPLSFAGISERMEGTITIEDISQLRLENQQIFCHIKLSGRDLNLITTVANQNIRLKLGSAQVAFDCEVKIRYDPQQQKLFVRPTAQGLDETNALQEGDIGKTLLLFLNGQEFGFAIQDLAPILAETSNKRITIHTQIRDVRSVPDALQFYLAPHITAASKK